MNEDEKYYTSLAMRKYGGGLVQALGIALTHADPENTKRLKNAFPEYFTQYEQMGKNLKKEIENDKT